jgi:predicted PurR-regulated permease PerM
MKIQNPFRVGLLAGLGVLLALLIGAMITQLATILTYVGAAIFLALGLDPLVSFLERRKVPRWLALLITVVVVLGAFVGIIFAVVPLIVQQASRLVTELVQYAQGITIDDFLNNLQNLVSPEIINIRDVYQQLLSYIGSNFDTITGGVLTVATGVIGGVFGAIIVLILTLYFTASLDSFKRGLYQLVPATRRQKFADITEQITKSVGRYVVGQAALALCNGILTFIFLTIIGAQLPAVFAFIAFLGSLIPLVGTLSGSVIIVLGQIVLLPESPATWITAGIYYIVYMQVEAYVLSPNIMNRAVKVPGVLVVIGALVGGTLLGILGALIAIPVVASIQLIIKQVVIPRQNEL